MATSYRDLVVWQRGIELVIEIYALTDQFPSSEKFGLISQMQRCAVSIPSNIAEGRYRGTRKDYLHFLRIAFGSGAELETQIEISKRLPQTKQLDFSKAELLLQEIMKMLNSMIQKLGD
jgi:four helix bundle protein